MLSAVISLSALLATGQMPLATTRTPVVRSLRSSLVPGATPLNLPTPTADRDRTVSTTFLNPARVPLLNGEQPYPLGPTSAPGCDEPTSRVPNTAVDMNSWAVSACYPRSTFCASVERWPFHSEPPDH